jgi:hypothetical protein
LSSCKHAEKAACSTNTQQEHAVTNTQREHAVTTRAGTELSPCF